MKYYVRISLVMFGFIAFFALAVSAKASFGTPISGIGYFAEEGECTEPVYGPNGQSPDFANTLTGDLEGCLYVFVERAECRPWGMYIESGTEIFIGRDSEGNEGTFQTTYIFKGKFEDCPNLSGQIYGGCKHPIVAGSGTGDFEDIRGRIDFVDDVEAGNFPFPGFLEFDHSY